MNLVLVGSVDIEEEEEEEEERLFDKINVH